MMIEISSQVRMLSAKLALKNLQEMTANETSDVSDLHSAKNMAASPKLAQSAVFKTDLSGLGSASSLMATVPGISSAYHEVITQAVHENVESDEFKQKLGSTLQDMITTFPNSNSVDKQVLTALNKGSLAIVNPPVESLDFTIKDQDGSEKGSGNVMDSNAFSTFLLDHLQTDADGSFSTTATGAYIDRSTGNNASWLQMDGNMYYMTWPDNDSQSESTSQ